MTPKQFCALVLFTAFAVPASAGTKIDDPVAFVKGIYTHWQTNRVPPEDIYTDRLKAMFAIDEKEAGDSPGRTFDFSFWCNCQDGDIHNPLVKGWHVINAKPDRMVVEAKFLLEKRPEHMLFYFDKTRAGWKLDDMQSMGPDPWTLSVACKYGWPDGH